MPHAVINGVNRKVRDGRLYRPPRPPALTHAAIRRKALSDAKTEAEKTLPKLFKLICDLAEELEEKTGEGRHYYEGVLQQIYEKAQVWKKKDWLDKRAEHIAALRGRTYRKNATALGEFVGAVCETAKLNSKTASRWATQLNAALKENVKPKDLKKYLRNF